MGGLIIDKHLRFFEWFPKVVLVISSNEPLSQFNSGAKPPTPLIAGGVKVRWSDK